MKAQTIDIQESTGRILSSAIFRPGGKKLLAKGHILREEDIRILQSEGLGQIWVAQLDEDEVAEDEAVCGVAGEMACVATKFSWQRAAAPTCLRRKIAASY